MLAAQELGSHLLRGEKIRDAGRTGAGKSSFAEK